PSIMKPSSQARSISSRCQRKSSAKWAPRVVNTYERITHLTANSSKPSPSTGSLLHSSMMTPTTDWLRLHGDAFDGKRVVVTGGAGFIGSHLVEALIELGAGVIVIDDLSSGRPQNVASGVELVKKSITDPSISPHFANIDYVFHQAAMA